LAIVFCFAFYLLQAFSWRSTEKEQQAAPQVHNLPMLP
jgi:hypothetical protein